MKNVKQYVPAYPDLQWCWYGLGDMQPVLLYDLLALRETIFVVEQSCIYQELDGLDKLAEHLLVTQKEAVVACLRVLPPAGKGGPVRIGRVAVSSQWRKQGLARLWCKTRSMGYGWTIRLAVFAWMRRPICRASICPWVSRFAGMNFLKTEFRIFQCKCRKGTV